MEFIDLIEFIVVLKVNVLLKFIVLLRYLKIEFSNIFEVIPDGKRVPKKMCTNY